MCGYPTIPPSQDKAALMKAKIARNPIKFAAMLATSPTEADAPAEAASKIFCSPLLKYNRQTYKCSHLDNFLILGTLLCHNCMGPYPLSNLILSSDLNLLSSVSGYESLDKANAHGAAITDAAIKEDASIWGIYIFNKQKYSEK